jgi:glucosamine 6-phosphate synthetase-like amidotransferase/phosphosugar isomerase protein
LKKQGPYSATETDNRKAKQINKIIITACGTASPCRHGGKTYLERIARIPVEVEIALRNFAIAIRYVDENQYCWRSAVG